MPTCGGKPASYGYEEIDASTFADWDVALPLMIGCDVRDMNQATQEILLNQDAIAINQDGLGRQGYYLGNMIHSEEVAEVWAKPLADGSVAVGLFNLGESNGRRISVAWESVGINPQTPCTVFDVWSKEKINNVKSSYTAYVDSHNVALIRITPK